MNRRWVWFSRQDDQKNSAISILACVETIASVCAFFFIIAYYDWGVRLLIGTIITPIFFLRSPESQEFTKEYYERAVERPQRFLMYGALVSLWLIYLDLPTWIILLIVPLGGVVFGHLYNSWYVQLTGSLAYFRKGLARLPQNYFSTLFATDITVRPEMFPESKGINGIPHWENSIFFFPRPRSPITFFLSVLTTLPLIGVVLLRFVAKASALTCLPLVYLSFPSLLLDNQKEQLIWIKSQSKKSIELFRLLLAVVVIISLVISVFDMPKLLSVQDVEAAENPLKMLATLYLVTDFSDIKPWQFLSVLSAVLSVVLYFFMDGCSKEAIAGRQTFSWRVNFIILGLRIRTVLLVLWILVTVYFSLKFYFAECELLDSVARFLSLFWGEQTCAAP